MRRTDILERNILKWIEEDLPNAEIARRLACKVDTLKSYYTKMGIQGTKVVREVLRRERQLKN